MSSTWPNASLRRSVRSVRNRRRRAYDVPDGTEMQVEDGGEAFDEVVLADWASRMHRY